MCYSDALVICILLPDLYERNQERCTLIHVLGWVDAHTWVRLCTRCWWPPSWDARMLLGTTQHWGFTSGILQTSQQLYNAAWGGVIFLHSQGLKILKAGAKCDSRSRGWIHNRNSACDLTKAELFHLGPPLLWLPMNKSPEVAAGCCPSTSPSRAQKQLHYALLIVSAPPSFQLPGKYSWTRRAWQVGKIKQSKMLAPSEDGSVTVLAGLSCCHVSHTGKWRGRESSSAVGSSHSPVFVLFVFATVSAFST